MIQHWMEELAAAEKWKPTNGDGPSQRQIRVFARALPAFEQQHGSKQFKVGALTEFINHNYGENVFAFEKSELRKADVRKARSNAKAAGVQLIETMNACHSFAARGTYKVISADDRTIQLLEWRSRKAYSVSSEVISRFKDRARKRGISPIDPDGTVHNAPSQTDSETILDAKERAIARMTKTIWQIVASANGQEVMRRVKKKNSGFATFQECEKHIEALLITQKGRCAITGLQLQFDGDDDELLWSPDRIDSAGHYEAGNLQLVCRFVNRWKSDSNDIEFRRLIGLVRSHEVRG